MGLTISDLPDVTDAGLDRLVDAVLTWGLPQLRDLPWRRTRDPWAVLAAEVMLQQTQVVRVLPKYAAFMARFPTPAACAEVPLGDVLGLWSGLGYPRRARNLQLAARMVVDEFHDEFPRTIPDLLRLPGVGSYTARAIMVFAFELPEAVVDTNIARVLARVSGERLTAKGAQAFADRLVPPEEAWAWNQVLMDLGASTCRPQPSCRRCPLQPWCTWSTGGCQAPDPADGSAGVSTPQSRFAGSDRQARGALLARLVKGAVGVAEAPVVMGVDAPRAERLVQSLIRDGLIVSVTSPAGGLLRLP